MERMPKRRLIGHSNIILETLSEVAEREGFKLHSDLPIGRDIGWDEAQVRLESEDLYVGFQLNQCPGCCAILIMSYVNMDHFTQGNFDYVLQMVEEAAFEAGFGSLMQTQVVPAYTPSTWRREPWIMCLDKGRGWAASPAFMNAKSGHLCVYLTKDLGHKRKMNGLEFPV
jgi:hypothetical protein